MENFKPGDRVRHKSTGQETVIENINEVGINYSRPIGENNGGFYEMFNGNYEKVEPSILDEILDSITPEEMEKTKEKMLKQLQKPPLGLIPRIIHQEHRKNEITAAVDRYMSYSHPIPIEWIEEYNEIVNKLKS